MDTPRRARGIGTVLVCGATGHTGRFVVAELARRGFDVVAAGRDALRLRALATAHPGTEVRVIDLDDVASLDRALDAAAAVVNTAGPFAVTAGPVVEAALRAGIAYVDVAAEIEANADMFARTAATPVVPAMAFFGGLGDLLVTAVMGDWASADEVHVAYALSSWHPTPGTRSAGEVSYERRDGRRLRFTQGVLQHHGDELVRQQWAFPEPLGTQAVLAGFTMADVVTVPSHLRVPEVVTYMSTRAAEDVGSADTPAPVATDELGRSDQTFVVDVLVRSAGLERRASATGRDIYAVTAVIVVEAVSRLLDGRTRSTGVVSAGAMFDATDFLRALAPHVEVTLP